MSSFWSALRSQQGANPTVGKAPSLKADVIKSGTPGVLAGAEMSFGVVRESQQIADNSVGPAKRHTEIELPPGITYQSGKFIRAPFKIRSH